MRFALSKTKVKASSLLEVLIALVCIVIIFTIGMTIYYNVVRSSATVQEYAGYNKLNQVYAETITQRKYFDEHFTWEENRVDKTVTKKTGYDQVYVLRLKIISPTDKIIAELKYLILDANEDN